MSEQPFALREVASNPLSGLSNTQAEQALLGAILLNNRAYDYSHGAIIAADFANGVHGRIFDAIAKLVERGIEANAVTLKQYFERDEALSAIGGSAYLARLVDAAVTVANAPHYAATIADLAKRREVVVAAQDIIADAAAVDLDRDAVTVLDDAEQKLFEIGERRTVSGAPRALGEIVGALLGDIEAAYKRGGAITVDTGLVALDKLISGMGAGELIVLAGRPGMGKSAFAGTIAANCAHHGKRSLIFSLEMSKAELAMRWVAGSTGIDTDRQRHGNVEPHDWHRLTEASEALSRLPIVVDDQPRLSVAQMRQRARRMRRRQGLDLIIVDHLQLVRQGGKQESRRLEIGDATAMLKAVAKELSVPVLLLSQLSRAVEQRDDKRPMLSDLRESGDIEQDADVVMFVYREEYYAARQIPKRRESETNEAYAARCADAEARVDDVKGLAEIIVAKNRHGRTGTAKAAWTAERQRFENLAY